MTDFHAGRSTRDSCIRRGRSVREKFGHRFEFNVDGLREYTTAQVIDIAA